MWIPGATKTEPAGQASTAVTGVAVICDVCRGRDEFLSQAVVDRAGDTVQLQRLLLRRGWTFDVEHRDLCPTCTRNAA